MSYTSKPYTREEIKESLIHESNRELGICEQIRWLYDLVYPMPEGEWKERMTEMLIDTLMMAKKMSDRLAYYAETYHDESGNKGKNLKPINKESFFRMREERV